jgi:hypothetical protein
LAGVLGILAERGQGDWEEAAVEGKDEDENRKTPTRIKRKDSNLEPLKKFFIYS